MISVGLVLIQIIQLYMIVIFVSVILSWLIGFGVVNIQNRFVRFVYDVTNRLTEPALGPIRRLMPDLGGIDLSPLVLIFGLILAESLIREYVLRSYG